MAATYVKSLWRSASTFFASVRSTISPENDEERDGEVEEDTAVTRALRAYYVEKGRPFPPWLSPDPNDSCPSSTSTYSRRSQILSDLWDEPLDRTITRVKSAREASSPASASVTPPFLSLRQKRAITAPQLDTSTEGMKKDLRGQYSNQRSSSHGEGTHLDQGSLRSK